MLDLEMLRQGLDKAYDQAHLLPPVEGRLRIQAVVAHAAVLLWIVLSEIVQEHLAAALVRLRIGDGLHEELTPYLLLRYRLALHELLEFLDILVAVVCDALGILPVPACTPGLLIVSLDALRNVVMDDETDVRLVDTHAERNGGDDHVHILHQEAVLVLRPCPGIQSRMVRKSFYSVNIQKVRNLFHLLPAEAVYDARLARILLDVTDYVFLRFNLVPDFVAQVRTVEGRLEHRSIHYSKVLLDVVLDLRGSGGGEGDDRSPAYGLHHIPDLPVFRSEIVSPFRDAVRLIDGIERNVHFPEKFHVLILSQGFRSHVQQLCHPRQQVLAHFLDLSFVQGRVQEMCYAVLLLNEPADDIDLVLHQGDERRNDYRRPWHHQCRQLEAQRLSTAGRHQDESIPAIQKVPDNGFLVSLEGIKTEKIFQFGVEYGGTGSHSVRDYTLNIVILFRNTKPDSHQIFGK